MRSVAEIRRDLEGKLEDWRLRAAAIADGLTHSDPQTRALFERELRDIAEQRRLVSERLDALRHEEIDLWEREDFREGLLEAWDAMGADIDRLLAHVARPPH